MIRCVAVGAVRLGGAARLVHDPGVGVSSPGEIREPRMGHYLFAHRAVPRAFLRDPAAIMGILASDDAMEFLSGMWEVLGAELEPEHRVSPEGLALEHYELTHGVFVALVVMPPIRRGLEAHFVAVIARLEGDEAFARCFSLDHLPDLDPPAAVLEWDADGKHQVVRDACDPSREAFLDAIEDTLGIDTDAHRSQE